MSLFASPSRRKKKPAAAAIAGATSAAGDRYKRHRARAGAVQAEASRKGRDIGTIPTIQNPARRAAASKSFRLHCETYHSDRFYLGWSEDHLTAIDRIEGAILRGDLFAMAMPRGSGKTSLTEAGVEWAALNGYRRFMPLIGADEAHAVGMLENIKAELEENELLFADYPEVSYCIRCLERTPQRRLIHAGKLLTIEWHAKEIVLPTIAGSPAGGCCIRARGLLSRIRGMSRQGVRPDLVAIDDPQTDTSARSADQVQKRLGVLAGAILGLAGPDKEIAGIMPCTVICPGDVADQLLDSQKYPQWHGLRTKLVYSFPTATADWEEYAKLRAADQRDGSDTATNLYREKQAAMDEGSKVAWPARRNPGELSALQHAMNLRLDVGPSAFDAEYQNEPQRAAAGDEEQPDPAAIRARLNRMKRGLVPAWAAHLVATIDVSKKLLWWQVTGFKPDFTAAVVDYGAFPDQQRRYLTLADASKTLARKFPGRKLEGTLYAGIEALVEQLCGREWPVDGGGVKRISKVLIDANWGDSTDTVYLAARQSKYAHLLIPSHGTFVGAKKTPMAGWSAATAVHVGDHWRIPKLEKKRQIHHVLGDANYWKSFTHRALKIPMGDSGCLSLFGDDQDLHRMWADQLCAEHRDLVRANEREVDEWSQRPNHPDNHFLDLTYMSCVAASILGCRALLAETKPPKPRAPRKAYYYQGGKWQR